MMRDCLQSHIELRVMNKIIKLNICFISEYFIILESKRFSNVHAVIITAVFSNPLQNTETFFL